MYLLCYYDFENTRIRELIMKKYTTSDRLKQIMSSRNLKQSDILRAVQPYCKKYNIKLGKSILSQYISGGVEPGQVKLTILGLALNVSEVWLMGYDVPMEREKPATQTDSGLETEYINLFQLLSPEQQTLVISMIKGILSNQ